MKRGGHLLLWAVGILLCIALPTCGLAQEACPVPANQTPCPSDRVCLSFTAPAGNTDGSLLSAAQKPLTFHVWRRAATGSWVRLAYNTRATSITLAGEPRGLQCWAFTAMAASGDESALSCYACKTIRFPGPSDGRIERPTDGGIESPQEE